MTASNVEVRTVSRIPQGVLAAALILLGSMSEAGAQQKQPGIIVAHSRAETQVFLGSPSIAVLPSGDYVVSHDHFGDGAKEKRLMGVTDVYRSSDRGLTWRKVSRLRGQHWSNLFVHRENLYLLGTHPGQIAIRRSMDGGISWTEPKDSKSGLLTKEKGYHTAPTPTVLHRGRLVRAFEKSEQRGFSGMKPMLISAPKDADLLDAANWTQSPVVVHDRAWLPQKEFRGWLEGNAVVSPDGKLVNILRVHTFLSEERAAILSFNDDLTPQTIAPKQDVVKMPGGAKKFVIRRDGRERYWSLVNWVPKADRAPHPARYRNRLALVSSANLRQWKVHDIVLEGDDPKNIGFQYVDFQFEGDDIIFVSRTGFPDEFGGPDNFHNSNMITFHRIKNFRK